MAPLATFTSVKYFYKVCNMVNGGNKMVNRSVNHFYLRFTRSVNYFYRVTAPLAILPLIFTW